MQQGLRSPAWPGPGRKPCRSPDPDVRFSRVMRTSCRIAWFVAAVLWLAPCGYASFAETACSSSSDCNDLNTCTVDFCDSQTGCVHIPVGPHISCRVNACTTMGTCQGSICQGTSELACPSDGSSCTVDCDPGQGCTHVQNCDDHDSCTADACDPSLGCSHVHACDDADPCTVDQCTASGCTHQSGECGDGISLSLIKGPFANSVTLSWWGGPYAVHVYRGTSPTTISAHLSDPGSGSYTDYRFNPPQQTGAWFYLVIPF